MEPNTIEQQIEQEVAHARTQIQEGREFPPWGIGTVLFMTALYLAIYYILIGFATGIISNPNYASYVIPRVRFIVSVCFLIVVGLAQLSFFCITYAVVRSHCLSLSRIGFLTQDIPTFLPRAILIGCCCGFFIALWEKLAIRQSSTDLITTLWERSTGKQSIIVEVVAKDYPLIMVLYIVVYSIMTPLSEEVFFRGFAYPAFMKRFSVSVAIFLNSLLFLTSHGFIYYQPLLGVPIFIIGVLLTLFYERTGLLPLCMLIHSLTNLIPKLFIWL